MWWLIGIAGLYGVYKILAMREHLIETSIDMLKAKIRKHRELARKGNRESLKYLQSLDAVVARLEKEGGAASSQILTTLQFEGLYPPSAI